MSQESQNDFKVEIESSDDGNIIRITNISIDDERLTFDKAYQLASELHLRAKLLDVQIAPALRILEVKTKAAVLWMIKGDTEIISDVVSDSAHKIALALLKEHPRCLRQIEVRKLTGVGNATVSDNLRLNIQSTELFFISCNNGFQLSDEGIDWVIDEIIPRYCK